MKKVLINSNAKDLFVQLLPPVAEEVNDEDLISMKQIFNYADECQAMIYFFDLKEDFMLIDPYKHFKEKWIINN